MPLEQHAILFEPLSVGPKTLRNRFYQVPHGPGFGSEKPRARARYAAVQAEGGWAVVSTGVCPVSPDGDIIPTHTERLWDEDDVRRLAVMADEAHEFGALAAVELGHGGADASSREPRWPLIAPSQLASDVRSQRVPKAMELADIRRIQADWVAAAKRARAAGFDIVYVYGGHTHLPVQFLSPFYNHREDEYGGSLENRARFWLETLELVREAVGEECAIAARHSISTERDGPVGVGMEESLEFVRMADHLVDLWDINIGTLASWGFDSAPSRFVPQNHELHWTQEVQKVTDTPVVGVGRLTDPDEMARIVRTGGLSLVGAARPSIADPFLPRKIEEGRIDDIRECIGCNICVATSTLGHMSCTQNPTTGEEWRRGWHPEREVRARRTDLPILVVGGGPAGLECAMGLGRKGFEYVHLVDAAEQVGGALRWMARLPGLGEWARVWEWRLHQLTQMSNVQVAPRTPLDLAGILDYGAETVIMATGSRWAGDGLNHITHAPIPGCDASRPHVLTPEQIMVEAKPIPGDRIVVYDCEGYFMGTALAARLAAEGRAVELLTPLGDLAPFTAETMEDGFVRARLAELGVGVRTRRRITAVAAGRVLAASEHGGPEEIEADGIVLVTQRLSEDTLYGELVDDRERLRSHGIEAVYRVGDCVAPRLLADAVFDGHRLAAEIESPDPAVPLPYEREESIPRGPEVNVQDERKEVGV
ncbi:MAG: NAD(P)-binding protein [Actinobacteria bacterium]|nr:NAD(P)-binding protein [Actinomycetota bacterium]